MACDLESDETDIDGSPNPSGWVPDGTWDDGGYGGACHTNHYDTPQFNTVGCQPGQQAFASDLAFGGNVFIAAACDWKEVQGGASTELALAFCMANGALALNTGNLVPGSLEVVQCGLDAVNCALNPVCGATGSVEICGADGVVDAVDYGYGGGAVNPWYGDTAAMFPASFNYVANGNPPVYSPCPAGGDVAAVYVLSFVDTYGGSPSVSTPTAGWIDSGAPCWSGCWIPSPLLPPLPPISVPQCIDGADNDGDGPADFPNDPGCSTPVDSSERGTIPCDDGIDNDNDGRTDYPDDPGCSSATDTSEVGQCQDGIDNDGDGFVDYPADPGCVSSADNSESPNPTPPNPPQPPQNRPSGRATGYA